MSTAELQKIRQQQARIAKDARAKIDTVKDDMSERECRSIEAEFDSMMAEHDQLQERANDITNADPRRPYRLPPSLVINGNKTGFENGNARQKISRTIGIDRPWRRWC